MHKTVNKDKSSGITGKIPSSEAHNYYVWKTLGDSRVRSRHAHRDNRIFHRDHPPEGGYPGEDYGCRCQAVPVPTHALLPEEFQDDSQSLQYGKLLESGKVDKFNKMVEADNKLEEVDKKLAAEGNRLIEGKKKSLNKFNKIMQEREKIHDDAVKKEAKFDKAIESDKSLAKKVDAIAKAKKKPKDKGPVRFGAQSALEREEEFRQRKQELIKKGIKGVPTVSDEDLKRTPFGDKNIPFEKERINPNTGEKEIWNGMIWLPKALYEKSRKSRKTYEFLRKYLPEFDEKFFPRKKKEFDFPRRYPGGSVD